MTRRPLAKTKLPSHVPNLAPTLRVASVIVKDPFCVVHVTVEALKQVIEKKEIRKKKTDAIVFAFEFPPFLQLFLYNGMFQKVLQAK